MQKHKFDLICNVQMVQPMQDNPHPLYIKTL